MSLVPLLVAFAFDRGPHVVPKDPDRLPRGAKARLGSARYVVRSDWNAPPVLSPDGKRVAIFVYSGFHPSHINVYEAETRRLLRTLRPKIHHGLHWIRFVSPTRILAGDSMNRGTPRQVFDTETGRCEVILNDPDSPAALCASDDARVLVDYDYTIWRTCKYRALDCRRPHRTRHLGRKRLGRLRLCEADSERGVSRRLTKSNRSVRTSANARAYDARGDKWPNPYDAPPPLAVGSERRRARWGKSVG